MPKDPKPAGSWYKRRKRKACDSCFRKKVCTVIRTMLNDAKCSRYNATLSIHNATGASITTLPVHTAELLVEAQALMPESKAASLSPRRREPRPIRTMPVMIVCVSFRQMVIPKLTVVQMSLQSRPGTWLVSTGSTSSLTPGRNGLNLEWEKKPTLRNYAHLNPHG